MRVGLLRYFNELELQEEYGGSGNKKYDFYEVTQCKNLREFLLMNLEKTQV